MTVIVFSGVKGGVGTSTVAINIAGQMASREATRLLSTSDASDWSLHLRGLFARKDLNLPKSWSPATETSDVWEKAAGTDALKCLSLDDPSLDPVETAKLEKSSLSVMTSNYLSSMHLQPSFAAS